MEKIINLSKRHWGLVFSEILIVFGAVVIGEYFLIVVGINLFTLFIALPLIFIGFAVRSYFTSSSKRKGKDSGKEYSRKIRKSLSGRPKFKRI